MKKILLVATVQSHIAQFHKPLIAQLHAFGYEVHVAARNNLQEKNGLTLTEPDQIFSVPFERSPFSLRNLSAYTQLKKIIRSGGYDVVHCNTPVGGILSRLVCAPLRKKGLKVVYTAHGFHFYRGAPVKNWLLYYPLELIFSYVTDCLITINTEDFAFAQKRLRAKKTVYIPGVGVDTDRFAFEAGVLDRSALGIPEDAFLLVSVGELNSNKNHRVVMKAMAGLKNPMIHYAIAGNGPLDTYLKQLAAQLGLINRVHFLGYRRDIPQLYKTAQACVLPSIREGLGLAGIEAMAAGLPVIAADNRGTRDFVVPGKNGMLCPSEDDAAFAAAIDKLFRDRNLMEEMSAACVHAAKQFDVKPVKVKLRSIYDDI